MNDNTTIHDISVFYTIRVDGANPNGDPNCGNAPRTFDSDGRGFITSECVKHKIRRELAMNGHRVYFYPENIEGECDLISKNEKIAESLGIVKSNLEKFPDAPNMILDARRKKFIDVRLFGDTASCVSIYSKESKSKKTTLRSATSCVSFDNPVSIDRPNVEYVALTSSIPLDENAKFGSSTKMGASRELVLDTTYFGSVGIFGGQAEKNGVTRKDIDDLVNSIVHMYDHDASCARPYGTCAVTNVIIYEDSGNEGLPIPYRLKRLVKDCIRNDGTIDKDKLSAIPGPTPRVIEL